MQVLDYRSRYLLSAGQLEKLRAQGHVKVFDCATHLVSDPDKGYAVKSGRSDYEKSHIPGAQFIDLQEELSDQASPYRFTMPSADEFAQLVASKGLSNADTAVVYASNHPMWACRLWWMFRVFGHDRVKVLDGGLSEWLGQGYEVSSQSSVASAGSYSVHDSAARVAQAEDILDGLAHGNACVLNALSEKQHRGEGPHYGRPGRITGSKSASWDKFLDRDQTFLENSELENVLADVGALQAEKVITYCGGGIAASIPLFAMALLGKEEQVSLYDNSLSEWANNADLPMTSDL